MQTNYQNKKIICPQIICLLYLFVYIGLFIYFIIIKVYVMSIILIFPIINYILVFYYVNYGIKHKEFYTFKYGIKISLIFSIISAMAKVLFYLICFIIFSSLNFDLHRSVILKNGSIKSKNSYINITNIVIFSIFYDFIITWILHCYKNKVKKYCRLLKNNQNLEINQLIIL